MILSAQCAAHRHASWSGIWSAVSEDILRYLNKSPENRAAGDNLKTRISAFATPQLLCLVAYRISHYLHVNGWRRLAAAASRLNLFVHKVNIPPDSCLGPGCFLPHPAGVTFYGVAGAGSTLYSLAVCTPEWLSDAGSPRLGDRVALGAHSWAAGPVSVGDDCRFAFAVGVRQDVPAKSVVIAREAWGSQLSRRNAGQRATA